VSQVERPDLAEEPLRGDGVTVGIVRIGDTVRRPVRPFTKTVQSFLAHLKQAGFQGAPTPFGIDEQGREVLSYVPGDVPREPLPADTASEEVLIALAGLVWRLHEAAAGWIPPTDATWSSPPGPAPAGLTPLFDEPELVGHRDYCPGNVVFRNGVPVALIDFDLARPTTRMLDVANALYWWAPLLDPVDRAPAFKDLDIPSRVALFADAYGFHGDQRQEFVPLVARMLHRMHVGMRSAAGADPVFARFWEEGVKDRLPRAEAWIACEGPAIAARLTGH
jgi:hypothetical protein